MTKLTNPLPLWLNARGTLLDSGYIYVGVAGADPEDQPLDVFFDGDMTIPASQPMRTLGGVIVNEAAPSQVFLAEADYSLRIRDADGNLLSYLPSVADAEPQFQPLDSDLTAIAALETTTFGRSLLALANGAALKTATGIPDCIPATGGAVSGNIVRSGAGSHSYWADAALTSGRMFVTSNTAPDPTSLSGDLWFKYVP